jgi:hypothetical protein
MAHEGFHEPVDKLSAETLDFHRAVESLIEELEAVDWYSQRAEVAKTPSSGRSPFTTATKRWSTRR